MKTKKLVLAVLLCFSVTGFAHDNQGKFEFACSGTRDNWSVNNKVQELDGFYYVWVKKEAINPKQSPVYFLVKMDPHYDRFKILQVEKVDDVASHDFSTIKWLDVRYRSVMEQIADKIRDLVWK